MKNTLVISGVALAAILVVSSYSITSTSFAQASTTLENQTTETIIVKCNQSMNKDLSLIRIYYGDGKTEKIELEKIGTKIDAEENNFNKIVNTLNKLNGEGYEVMSSTELAIPGANINTFILKKRNE